MSARSVDSSMNKGNKISKLADQLAGVLACQKSFSMYSHKPGVLVVIQETEIQIT